MGFSILPEDTSTCRPEEPGSNHQPFDRRLTLHPELQSPLTDMQNSREHIKLSPSSSGFGSYCFGLLDPLSRC